MSAFAAETLHEDFGSAGTAIGLGSRHYEAAKLVGENRGTVIARFRFDEGRPPKSIARSILRLRTASRLGYAIYCCDDNRHLLCSFSDRTGEHTWRIELPETEFGKEVSLGFSWDGTVLRAIKDGRIIASGVQPIPLEKPTMLHIGPYKDGWETPAPWADDVTVYSLKVYDTALTPAEIAAEAGVELKPLVETSPMFLAIPPKATPAGMPQLIMGNHPEISGKIPEHGFRLSYDDENLYCWFKSRFSLHDSVIEGEERTAAKEPALWGTESYEFRFQVAGHAYCFGGNVAGGYSEGRDEDYAWNVPWSYVTKKAMNIDDTFLWTGDIAIPWKSLGLEKRPDELAFNFCRSWKLPKIGCHTSLHLKGGSYADVGDFVKAKLGPAPAYELLSRTNPSEGTYEEKFRLVSGKRTRVTYDIALAALDGSLAPMSVVKRSYVLESGETKEDTMKAATGIPGYDAIVHTLTEGDRVVMREIVPFKLDDKFFFAHPYLLAKKIRVEIKNVMLKLKYGADFRGRLVLAGPDGNKVGEWEVAADEMEVPFSLEGKVGKYTLDLVDAKGGRKIDSAVIDYPGLGDWAKQDFHNDRVLPPFKPLVTEVGKNGFRSSFSMREYEWRNSLLPSRMKSQGADVLTKPVELLIGDEPVKGGRVTVGKSTATRVEFQASTSTSTSTSTSSWLEYDGCNFNTLTVKGAEGKPLRIRFTMPSGIAKFLHGARGGAWGLKTTMEVPSGSSTLHYYPVLWISDQEKGLCFFTESRNGWNGNEKKCFSIEKGEKETVVTIDVMEKLPAEFTCRFGFMATPIRPLAENHPYNPINATWAMPLNRPGRRPVCFIGMLANEKYKYGDTASSFGDQDDESARKTGFAMTKMFEECRAHPETMPFPYNDARWLSTRYREVAAYLNDWKLVPELSLDNEGTGHFMYDLCPTTLGSDYWMWRLRLMLKRYPEQRGIYCDFGTVKECGNADHGCRNEIPLLAYREYVRRMAAVQTDFYTNTPIVVLHTTDCVQVPCLAFASHLYNGEQVRQASTAMLHNKRDILDNYGLDMLGLELSTLPIGVANGPYFPFDRLSAKNGGDEEDAPYKFRMDKAAFAGCLPHGHFPATSRGHYGIFDKVFRVYEDFGVGAGAEFLGYWKQPVKVVKGKDVYVSVYRNRGKALLVIGHIAKEHLDQDVEIDLSPLKLTNLATAVDTMTREDPDYQWLYVQQKKYNVPIWRCPLDLGEFGTKVLSFDGRTLKYHLPFHSYGIVEVSRVD